MQTKTCQAREAISGTAFRSSGDDCLKESLTEDNEGNEGGKETFAAFVSFCLFRMITFSRLCRFHQ
jgi:hypothetical protein